MEIELYSETNFMKEALREARKALAKNEVPIGAIVVCQNRIIGRGYNLTETLHDVTAHAEMQALTAASNFLGAKYLPDCTLYVSIEPCVMCAGAIYWFQLSRLVFGSADKKRGFMTAGTNLLHPRTKISSGLLHEECGALLSSFFESKRN